MTRASWQDDRRGAVSIIFATTVIPLAMSVGLAVDYSFYIQAQAQLSLAADAGAIHAVRIASSAFIAGQSAPIAGEAGATAGLQWFNAQLGILSTATISQSDINIPPVGYDQASSKFTAVVSYTATVPTHFGGLFHIPSWPIHGVANAVITTNSYVEIAMLLDNSSSMLIGARPSDIIALETLTVCAPYGTINNGPDNPHRLNEYAFHYGAAFNYAGSQQLPNFANTMLSPNPDGACDSGFDGDPTQCPDAASLIVGSFTGLPTAGILKNGQCPTGTGTPTPLTLKGDSKPEMVNVPAAPCGFACHTPVNNGAQDYYALARNPAIQPPILLRFDVIQAAVAQIIQTLKTKVQVPNQFSVGVFDFSSVVNQVHPAPGGPFVEADSNLDQAEADVSAIATPSTPDQPDTNFAGAATYLSGVLTAGGDGSTPDSGGKPNSRRKNLFLITDGLEDFPVNGIRLMTGMNAPAPGVLTDYCGPLKTLGFNIYVLYTPYYPLPNPFYLSNGPKGQVEPAATSNVVAGLKACATDPTQYYQASSQADINSALLKMLQSALNTPGRLTL